MGEGDPGNKRPKQPGSGDIFAGRGRVPLGDIIDSFGYAPGTPEYTHLQGWIATAMEETLGAHIRDNFLFQVDERKARTLRTLAQESLEFIRDAQNLPPEEVAAAALQLPPTHPSLENPSKLRTPDRSHPWIKPAKKETIASPPVELTEGEEAEVPGKPTHAPKGSYTAGELLHEAKSPSSLKERLQLKRIAEEEGFTITNGRFDIPPERLDAFLDRINPQRNLKKGKKK